MASLMLVALSGSEKGKSFIFDQDSILIGSDESCDIRLSNGVGCGAIVAEITKRGSGYELTRHDSNCLISINNNLVTRLPVGRSIELQDGDQLGFRQEGAREARYSLHVIEDRSIIPNEAQVSKMLFPEVDNVGHIHPQTATKFLKGLACGLWAEIPRRVKMLALFVTGFFLLGAVFSLVYILYEIHLQWTSINNINFERAKYEQRIERLREENEKLKQGLKREIERINSATIITDSYKSGVCLIQGVYTFVEPKTGAKLRYLDSSFEGRLPMDEQGQLNVSFEGTGAIFYESFSGTGFSVAEGKLLTNRHVVHPWWQSEDPFDRLMLVQDARPELLELYGYFPGIKTRFELKVDKVSSQHDLALCSFEQTEQIAIPILPLDPSSQAAAVGQRIVVLGYPTGLEGLIQRLGDEKLKRRLLRQDPDTQLAELAKQGLIHPITTQGHINGLNAGRIVHDAATAEGGSGSPIFNSDGKVIGINAAIIVDSRGPVQGSNLGIPILFAMDFLGKQAEED
ncbi:MAG: trypsin-like peptidase domain-containing protein [Acidobacteriota bacterium]|nr:trypsin-like peptidase domain-containing protein [Blastocatellia bacterium]MDW8411338.1 trypsin-like peptidase domain-containing protein [Acidobacteriota bacterium]